MDDWKEYMELDDILNSLIYNFYIRSKSGEQNELNYGRGMNICTIV